MKIFYDEYQDFFWAKWYKNPVIWYQQRKFVKMLSEKMERMVSDGAIETLHTPKSDNPWTS